MRVLTLALALLTTGCGRGCRRPAAVPDDAAEFDDAVPPAPPTDAPPVRTACRRSGGTAISALQPDAGLEALVVAPVGRGTRAFWSVAGEDAIGHWSSSDGAVGRVGTGAGERSDPVLGLDGTGALAAAWVRSGMGEREHVVWTADGDAGRCASTEGRDEGLSLALAGLGRGWLVAWDEDGPAPAAGSIRAQLATVTPAGLRCDATRSLSLPAQDAADPTAVGLPDGRAAVFWLTARDVDATESNDTATDVWGVAVDAAGAPAGAPLRITRAVDHHFGLAALSAAGAVWLAFRGGGPSDSEGRGDGGEVRAVRVDVGPAGLLRAGDVAVLTDEGANPTGAPRVTRPLSSDAAVEVWWRERHGERVEVRHRGVDGAGRPPGATLPAWVEPALGGALPAWVDERATAWVGRVGDRGAEVSRFSCGPGR